MKAIIVYEARTLDPIAIKGYRGAAARYRQANNTGIHDDDLCCQMAYDSLAGKYGHRLLATGESKHLLLPEGPNPNPFAYRDLISPEQFNRIKSGAELCAIVYPAALGLLEQAGVNKIRNLKSPYAEQELINAVRTLHDLCWFTQIVPPSTMFFDAGINLLTSRGERYVGAWKVQVNPFRGVYLQADENAPGYDRQSIRAMAITTRFASPESASSGLRGLAKIFPDLVLEEKLLVGNLPAYIMKLYKQIEDSTSNYWARADWPAGKNPPLGMANYREMTSLAGMAHIEFLKPIFESLGIQPHRIDYHDDKSNMHYQIAVENLDDVTWLISRGYYDGSRIPTIHATFNGQEIAIEFPPWAFRLGSNFAMQVINGPNSYTLESILAGIKASFPAK